MAVAHDSCSESHSGTTGGTGAGPHTWTHGGRAEASGGVQGVLVFVTENVNADDSTAVTYGGVTLNPVSGGYAASSTTEAATCKAWFIGSGLSTKGGNQTVSVSRNNNSNVMYCVSITVTAARDTEIAGTPVLLTTLGAIAEENVDSGLRVALRYAGGPSGGSNPVAAGANSTALIGIDYGTRVATFWRETAAGSGSRPVGGSYGTSDDRCLVHLAIAEVWVHPVARICQLGPGGW